MSWVVTIVIAFLIVIPVRRFCIESYRISTSAMEDALHQGDYILVNKLPFEGNPGRNKVVLFTSPLLKDTVSTPLLLSRCIGMPGDTILVSGDGYEVNGKLLPHSPRALNTCFITQKSAADFLKALQKLSIPVRNVEDARRFGFSFSLTFFRKNINCVEELTEEMNIHFYPEISLLRTSWLFPVKAGHTAWMKLPLSLARKRYWPRPEKRLFFVTESYI